MIRIYVLDLSGCGLHNSDAALHWSDWTENGGSPCWAPSYKLAKDNKEDEPSCGCVNLSRALLMCIFKPTCLTLPSARACPRTCFCACQSVSWGKIISSALSGSPRGLLVCWALLEPACREADMTAVLENEAKRTITPSASIFILQDDVSTSVVYMKWRTPSQN